MNGTVIISGVDHSEERIVTFYAYPSNPTVSNYVVTFILIVLLSLYAKGFGQKIVPTFYPVDNKVFSLKPVAQISLRYEDEETLEEINQIVEGLFSN